jgi:GMP synthase (glutamine-hydrolysing)
VPPGMRVAVIYHCPQTTGRLDDALSEVRAQVDRHYLDQGDPVPSGLIYDRVVVLGGAMGAYDSDHFWWLEEEKDWLAGLVESEIPVLGICLGAQLLADALGGKAYKADVPEVAVLSLQLTEEGRRHPVVSLAQPSVFSLHQDTFQLPEGAALLAHSDRFPHAFRYGSALALQFHPDADLELALSWGREEWSILGASGIEFDDYTAQVKSADEDLDRSSREIFRAWLQ